MVKSPAWPATPPIRRARGSCTTPRTGWPFSSVTSARSSVAGDSLAAARRSKDVAQARRLLALALVLEGASRTEAAAAASLHSPQAQGWIDNYTPAANPATHRQYPGALSAKDARAPRAGISASLGRGTERPPQKGEEHEDGERRTTQT